VRRSACYTLQTINSGSSSSSSGGGGDVAFWYGDVLPILPDAWNET